MNHKQPEITTRQRWLAIETCVGEFFIDWDLVGSTTQDYLTNPEDIAFSAVANEVYIYTEATSPDDVYNVSEVAGHGARLSAAGYMDATYWAVFETKQQAAQHLLNMYGNDDTPEGWEAKLEEIANTPEPTKD